MDEYDAILNFCHKNYLFPFSIIASGKHKTNRHDGFGNAICTKWKLVLTFSYLFISENANCAEI